MPGADYIALFTRALDEAGLTYMVTGATAAIVYGKPRYTNDVDIVIVLPSEAAAKLNTASPRPVLCAAAGNHPNRPKGGHINLIHEETGYKADLYPVGSDSLHEWALPRRQRFELPGGSVWVAPPEYVILRKLEFFREGGSSKHLTDIQAMLDVSGESIDRGMLAEWVQRLGLHAEWARIC